MMLMQGTHRPSADNAGGFRRLAFINPATDKRKEETISKSRTTAAGHTLCPIVKRQISAS